MAEQKSHRPLYDDPLERQRDAGNLFKTLDLSVRSPNRFVGTLRDVEYPMSARVVLLAQSGDLRLRRGAPAQGFDPFVGRGALHEVFYFHFFSCLICIRFDGQKTAFLYKYNQKRNKIQMPFLMTKLHRTHGALLRPEKPFTAPTNALPGPRGTLWRPFLLHSRSGIRRLPPPGGRGSRGPAD